MAPLKTKASRRTVTPKEGMMTSPPPGHGQKVEGPAGCSMVVFAFQEGWGAEARVTDTRKSCAFELAHLHADKRIRWRMLSPTPSDSETLPIDKAPDRGCYD